MADRHAARAAVWTLGLVLIAATALPLVPTDDWWIRALEFPRPQVAVMLVLAVAGACFLLDQRCLATPGLIAGLLAAFGLQLSYIWP